MLDVDSGAIVGKIENTLGVHGIAIAADIGRGFVSDGQSSTVTIFDLKTLKTIAEVPTGKKPDAIIYDPATSRVFAFNGGSNSATVIEGKDGKVAGTIDLGGGPEFAAADGNGYVYNNLEDESLVLKINSRTLKVEQRWPTAPCASPSSMAIDRANRQIVSRLPQQSHGGHERGHRPGHHNAADRRSRGCNSFRYRDAVDFQLQRRRHRHRDSPGKPGQVFDRRNCENLASREDLGARSENASIISVDRRVGAV